MRSLPLILFLFAATLFFQACESGTPSTETPEVANGQVEPPGQPTQPQSGASDELDLEAIETRSQNVSFSPFNEEIATGRESGESWTGSPLTVALRFAGEGMECREKTVQARSLSGESFNRVIVTVIEDGFMDDSLRGSIMILRMESQNGFWRITSAKKAWRCWEDRGHSEFNSEPCN